MTAQATLFALPETAGVADEHPFAGLEVGDAVAGRFLCTRKSLPTLASGKSYVSVSLRRGSRTIQGRAFTDVLRLGSQFAVGDIVDVDGRLIRYRNRRQVEIKSIISAEHQRPTDLLPVAHRDVDELDGFLEHLAGEVSDPHLRRLLHELLLDEDLRDLWRTSPCTTRGHHAYIGGLLEHSVAVAVLAIETCTLHPALDGDLLLTAALIHDLGLTQAFTYGAHFEQRPQPEPGWWSLGLHIVREAAAHAAVPAGRWPPLEHCIRAPHRDDDDVPSPEMVALRSIDALDRQVATSKSRLRRLLANAA